MSCDVKAKEPRVLMRGNKGIGDVRIHAPHITKEMTARADNTCDIGKIFCRAVFHKWF